jgi:hypothetical protein
MYVRKALSTVFWIWRLQDILLSQVRPSYVTLFTKWTSRPFTCYTSAGTLVSLMDKEIVWDFLHWSLCSSAHSTDSLRWGHVAVFRENDVHVSLCLYVASVLTANSSYVVVWLISGLLSSDGSLVVPAVTTQRTISQLSRDNIYLKNMPRFSENVWWNVK